MAIPASRIVSVQPRLISGGSSNLELNGLLLTVNPILSVDTMVIEFGSAASVANYFGENSVEYSAALTYFTSYDNKFSSPRSFMIARRVDRAVHGWLRSASVSRTISSLKSVANGGMTIIIDGTAVSLSGLNFSGIVTYSDISDILQTALGAEVSGTTVAYSSLTNAFTITSPTTGIDSSVSFGDNPVSGDNLAILLGFTEELGAVISSGSPALSEVEQMKAILNKTQNWFGFTTAWEADSDEILGWAEWANDNYGWAYFPYSMTDADVSADSSSDTMSLLKAANLDHTEIHYGTLNHSIFAMSVWAAVPWERQNGSITGAFKYQSGLGASVTSETVASVLEQKRANYIGNFATRNASFLGLYPGQLSSQNSYEFMDAYAGSVWFNNRLQVALMDGIMNSPRTPYNDRGYTMIKAWTMDAIIEATRNGVIEAGVSLSERQKTEVQNEAGLDISKELNVYGYYIQVLDPGSSVRSQRGSPVISIWYTYGGAVLKLNVASTAIL